MNDPLAVYLHDHLAGADMAIKLLRHLHQHQEPAEFKTFTAELLADVENDRQILQQLADSIGSGTNLVKEVGSWVGEKASLLKVNAADTTEFSRFEALELLSLGVLGKKQLWLALRVVRNAVAELQATDFDELIARADRQYETLEVRRRGLAISALCGTDMRRAERG